MYKNEVMRLLEQIDRDRPKINQVFAQYDAQITRQFEQIQATIESFRPAWAGMTEMAETASRIVRDAFPPNWPDDMDLDIPKLEDIAEKDGIPIFYVPRATIVAELVEASDFDARLTIIGERTEEIGQDCREALRVSVHDQIADRTVLARKAVDAFVEGHYESAQALAVVVCDSNLKTHVPAGYKKMRAVLALGESDEVALWSMLRLLMPMATAVPFLVEWHGEPDSMPTTLSRHATIHGASTAQLNRLNATLAIMLATTMIRALDAGISRYGKVFEL